MEIFSAMLDSIREPLLVLGSDFKIVKANQSFYHTFNVTPQDTEGALIYDLGNRQWDIPRLRELLEDILPQNSIFNDFEVEHHFEGIGPKLMHLNARRLHGEATRPPLILLAIEDVTEREYYKRHLEDIVSSRTAELKVAREEAENSKQIAETGLVEIKKLKEQLETERAYLQEEIKLEYNHENIIGQSDAINYVFFKIEQIAEHGHPCIDTRRNRDRERACRARDTRLEPAQRSRGRQNELRDPAFEPHRKRTLRA